MLGDHLVGIGACPLEDPIGLAAAVLNDGSS
jgi:hypothetical protein